jgi:hypothetical protein
MYHEKELVVSTVQIKPKFKIISDRRGIIFTKGKRKEKQYKTKNVVS